MVKKTLVAMVILMGVVLVPRPVLAQQCTTQLADCYVAAAKIDSFWYRWAAGIDCETDYAGCLRSAIFAS